MNRRTVRLYTYYVGAAIGGIVALFVGVNIAYRIAKKKMMKAK
jgi:hypothetical protein